MRKYVKTLFSIVLILALIFCVAGCGTQEKKDDASQTPSEEKYPSKPVKIVVTHAAGSANDLPPRLIQPYLQKALGAPVVIENMPGAAGGVARSYVFKAPADGYTLLASGQPSMSSGFITAGGDYDPLQFVPVYCLTGKGYNAFAVPADSQYKTPKDLIEAAQKGPIPTACAGVGGTGFLVMTLANAVLGTNFEYVPFDSAGEATMAVAGGQVPCGVTTFDFWIPLEKQGNVRMIGLTGSERSELCPDVPTFLEAGYSGIQTDDYRGIYAPPGLPQDILDTLAAAFEEAAKDPGFIEAAENAKASLKLLGPEEFADEVRATHEQVMNVSDQLKDATKQ